MASLDDTDGALGNFFLDLEFEELSALQGLPGEIVDHRGHAEIPFRELDDHIAGGQLKLRFQNDPPLFQKTVHELSGTRILFQEDTWQVFQLPVLHSLSL